MYKEEIANLATNILITNCLLQKKWYNIVYSKALKLDKKTVFTV